MYRDLELGFREVFAQDGRHLFVIGRHGDQFHWLFGLQASESTAHRIVWRSDVGQLNVLAGDRLGDEFGKATMARHVGMDRVAHHQHPGCFIFSTLFVPGLEAIDQRQLRVRGNLPNGFRIFGQPSVWASFILVNRVGGTQNNRGAGIETAARDGFCVVTEFLQRYPCYVVHAEHDDDQVRSS